MLKLQPASGPMPGREQIIYARWERLVDQFGQVGTKLRQGDTAFAGTGDSGGVGGDGFAEGLALWALAQRGDDPDWLASAAGSLARLAMSFGSSSRHHSSTAASFGPPTSRTTSS